MKMGAHKYILPNDSHKIILLTIYVSLPRVILLLVKLVVIIIINC